MAVQFCIEGIPTKKKDTVPALKYIPKKKLLEETAKVDNDLCKFKTHNITKTNE